MRILQTGKAGFTLLELMIALTIGSVIMTAVYGIFSTVTAAYVRNEIVLSALNEARFIFKQLKKDADSFHHSGGAEDLICGSDNCSFPIHIDNGKKALVRYGLNPNGELIRQVTVDSANTKMLLSMNLETVEFEPKLKVNRTNSGTAAMVTLYLTFKDKFEKKTFSHNVYFEIGFCNQASQ